MDAGKHTNVHMKTKLKDCIRLNKPGSFVNFIRKHALSFLKAQGFLLGKGTYPIQKTFYYQKRVQKT